MDDYEKLLSQAYKKVKPIEYSGERFEVPKIKGHVEGTKTILTNFQQISSTLRRKPEHMLKFLLKELATSGKLQDALIQMQMLHPLHCYNPYGQLVSVH